jgi:transcriptional regulator with XRE-family HTH domain
MSDGALAKNIGNFVKHHRMEQNQSQDSLSKSAGISRSTLSLLERGETVTLATLIRVLRVLEQLHIMDSFWVTQTLSPLALAKLEKSKRRRVRVKRVETATSKFTTETSKKIPNATDGDF